MPDVTVNIDSSAYDLAVRRYVHDLGIEANKAVRTSARLLAHDLVRLVAPASLSQGRKAVARDISRAMWAIDPTKIHNKILRQAVQDGEFDVVQAFINNLRKAGKGGILAGFRLEHFSPELHQRARDRRGRVRRDQKVIVLERAEHKRYIRQVQGHVGSSRFAFANAEAKLGGNPAGWMLGHNPAFASYEEGREADAPYVVMANRGPGVENVEASLVQRALNRRAVAMVRDVDQILAGRGSRYFD